MSDTKISGLTALSSQPDTADLVPIVDVSDTSMAATGTDKKVLYSNFMGGVWTQNTPTVTSQTGTITTVGSHNIYYVVLGKTVFFTVDIVITTAGTGAGYLHSTLPFTPSFYTAGGGRENGLTGAAIQWRANTDGTMDMWLATGSTAIASGAEFLLCGVCQIA